MKTSIALVKNEGQIPNTIERALRERRAIAMLIGISFIPFRLSGSFP